MMEFGMIDDHGELYVICPNCGAWIPLELFKEDHQCHDCGFKN